MAKILELFAGGRCIGKAAEKLGHEVFSVDWTAYDGIDLVKDIGSLSRTDLPWFPDHIHASFDCTTYTIAAISHHRNGTEPKSEYAKQCDEVNQHVLRLFNTWKNLNPNLTITIENPRGMLRKMPFMQYLPRYTVWYCQYGDDRAKPTDIWTNLIWEPRPVCHNGNKNCHHAPAPRGSKTGTQGRKGSYNRSMMPEQLCIELMKCL
jgi:site-specific DNA-cytosine methylase